jgi:hypothetical protein
MATKAKFDRSEFKGTDLKAIEEQNKLIASGSSKKRDYLQIEDGSNKLRILPAHPNSDPNNKYAQQKFVAWLQVEDKDGKLQNRSFLNAKVHAGQEKDLVEEYHKLATKLIAADDDLDTQVKAQKLKDISDYKLGIKHQGKWLAYAVDTSKEETEEGRRGLVEISNGIKKQMDEESLAEIEEDPTAADVISDPNSGRVITIKKFPKKPSTERYSVLLGRKDSPVEDSDLDWLVDEDSLVDILFKGVNYHQGTLEYVLQGIENYDDKYDVGVADTEEFKEIYKELKAALPEAPVRDDNGSSSDEDTSKKSKRDRKPKKTLTFGEMSKDEIKQFIMDNDLDVPVRRKDSVEDLLDRLEDFADLSPENTPADYKPASDSKDEAEDDIPFEDEDEDGKVDTKAVEAPKEERRSRRDRRTRG